MQNDNSEAVSAPSSRTPAHDKKALPNHTIISVRVDEEQKDGNDSSRRRTWLACLIGEKG